MTDLEQKLRAAIEKATQGGWKVDNCLYGYCYGVETTDDGSYSVETIGGNGGNSYSNVIATPAYGHSCKVNSDAYHNMKYIALANPENVKALLDELDRKDEELQAERERVRRLKKAYKKLKYAMEIVADWDGAFPEGLEMENGEWLSPNEIISESESILTADSDAGEKEGKKK